MTARAPAKPATNGTQTAVSEPTNAAEPDIVASAPYHVNVLIEGTAPILFHAWNNEAVAEKAAARKGSTQKKTDNVESYVYRDLDRNIAIPGRYLIGSMIDPRNGAAKYRQDPRSPRKSALDLYRAGVVATTEFAPIHSVSNPKQPTQVWDYLDSQRVMVQRAGVTRVRPAFLAGWRAEFQLLVLTPEYISPADLHECLTMAGRLVGIADYRPSYGRFNIVRYDIGLVN
jgi:hypothetical protein